MGRSQPPIQDIDAFDVVWERQDGGVDLVVSCSGPLDSSPRTLELIERKIVAYRVTIAHANFARTYRAAWSKDWEHDHCAACWAKFTECEGSDSQTEGYATGPDYPKGAGYEWICRQCFADLKTEMKWTEIGG